MKKGRAIITFKEIIDEADKYNSWKRMEIK